ncbi:patatin-like phospholipase family protein [Rhizobium sp. PL01]|uniref:patatin-like phospholipase family protein n=1 Tax=Rhizobium sp. PL01 TaxID=3085631 RepID=UPI00298243B3|nr:patatin-like phospholipase family protein [Rhizobium sp. PL01]MDW5316051.1 patatin-like phospholipase family protein [Rhizobium sp. PL01]
MLEQLPYPAIRALFARAEVFGGRSFILAGGGHLFEIGSPPDDLFFVTSGRLAVLRPDPEGRLHSIGIVHSGEIAGEMAFLDAAPHKSRLVALRDCEMTSIPSARFFEEANINPLLMGELARLLLRRIRRGTARTLSTEANVICIAALDGTDPAVTAQSLCAELRNLAHSCVVITSEDVALSKDWLTRAERDHDVVLLVARVEETVWAEECRRQADRLLLIGNASKPPPQGCAICEADPLSASRLVNLVLVRDDHRGPSYTAEWLAAVRPLRHYHVVRGSREDAARLSRALAGYSVGLVLSGGGARAFAHIGAIRALREAGVPIDQVGGTSMGAVIAAGVAMGWNDVALDAHLRQAFVASNPIDDIALPIIAMTRGRKVDARLREHFGTVKIEDLRIPLFCVSANLTSGHHVKHDDGDLCDALRASIALPGILPPMVKGGEVLADGGILRNLPTEIMRSVHDGSIIACDVTRSAGLNAEEIRPPMSWLRWFLSGDWRRGPPIVSILMRSATIGTSADWLASRLAADLYVAPELGMIDLRDWKSYPVAVEAGYAAMKTSLASLDGPATHLRHRRTMAAGDLPL